MLANQKISSQRPRELRRRVVLPARLRTGGQWSDACILNISSRGLMIHSGRAGPEGSRVELHRGDHLIIAHVVWRDGSRAGLRTDERLAVEEIMSLSQTGSLRLVASGGALIERRKRPRAPVPDARLRGRVFEFACIAGAAAFIAFGISQMAQRTLGTPLARAEAALGSHG